MTPQFSHAADRSLQTELYPLTFPAYLPSDRDRLSAQDRDRKSRFVNWISALSARLSGNVCPANGLRRFGRKI
jgi:hypothetical protein